MAFSYRMAGLAAVVAIPLGIAATSYALTDGSEPPPVPARVELDSPSPSPSATSATSSAPPSDEVVPRPPVSQEPPRQEPSGDDDDDDDTDRPGPGDGDADDGPDDDSDDD